MLLFLQYPLAPIHISNLPIKMHEVKKMSVQVTILQVVTIIILKNAN